MATLTDEQKKRNISKVLNLAFLDWRDDMVRDGTPVSQATQTEFTRELGVPHSSWSRWVNATSSPDFETIDTKLAPNKYIGPRIYEAAGISPRLPDNPRVRYIVANWKYVEEEDQEKLLSIFRKMVEKHDDDNDIDFDFSPSVA
jgi:hypothetical protein